MNNSNTTVIGNKNRDTKQGLKKFFNQKNDNQNLSGKILADNNNHIGQEGQSLSDMRNQSNSNGQNNTPINKNMVRSEFKMPSGNGQESDFNEVNDQVISSLGKVSLEERQTSVSTLTKKILIKATYTKSREVLRQTSNQIQNNNANGLPNQGTMKHTIGNSINESIKEVLVEINRHLVHRDSKLKDLMTKLLNTQKLTKNEINQVKSQITNLSGEINVLHQIISNLVSSYVIDN